MPVDRTSEARSVPEAHRSGGPFPAGAPEIVNTMLAGMLMVAVAGCGARTGLDAPSASCSAFAGADVPPVPEDAYWPDQAGCHLIGCTDGVSLVLTGPDGAPVSRAHYELVADGQVLTGDCVPGRATAGTGRVGCVALPAFTSIRLETTPASIEVVIDTPGQLAYRGCVIPRYHLHQPNGPGCRNICVEASATLRLW